MEAQDLRIGNLVKYKGTEFYAQVELIHGEKHFDCRDEYGTFTPNVDYEPIPLTPEWLEKLGFKYVKETLYGWKLDALVYYTKPQDDNKLDVLVWNGGRIECKYVHQLQNLYYSLTGTELKGNLYETPLKD